MQPLRTDLSIFDKLNLSLPPVGVKFLFFKPESIRLLEDEKNLSFCEMLREAWHSDRPFYFNKDYNEACVGKILLGMAGMEAFAESGQIGARLEIFQEPRANYSLYKHVPKFDRGTFNYVALSPMDKLNFEPDVLVISTDHDHAEIIMRSMTYATGEMYTSKTTPVMGCAWTFIYPFQSGCVNFLVPDMVHGMKGREIFPPNSILISIPYQWLPAMVKNLNEMKLHLPSHANKEQYLNEFGGILQDLSEKAKNP